MRGDGRGVGVGAVVSGGVDRMGGAGGVGGGSGGVRTTIYWETGAGSVAQQVQIPL